MPIRAKFIIRHAECYHYFWMRLFYDEALKQAALLKFKLYINAFDPEKSIASFLTFSKFAELISPLLKSISIASDIIFL